MKRPWTHLAIVGAIGVMVNTPSAQSLADLAKREEARRKAVKAPAKVITNEDLPRVPPPSSPAPAEATPAPEGAAAAPATGQGAGTAAASATVPGPAGSAASQPAAAPAADAAKPAAATPVKDEAYWRQRMASARDALARLQTFQDALQSRINALSADFVNRDDPAQRAVIGSDRQKALAELERVKKDIQQTQQTIADTQEEARRANVPAGWVR